MSDKKVIIIGAGPAGLTAAYELCKNSDIKPVILEASDSCGGISKTIEYHSNRMDLGGHRFFTKDDRINKLWEELMPIQSKPSYDDKLLNNVKDFPSTGPDPEVDDEVMLLRHRVSRIYFNKRFFDYPISLKPQTFINMGFAKTMSSGFGYIASIFHKLPEDSLENFYINRFGKPLYELFFKDYTTKLWGVSPKQLSASWGAQRVKGLSLFKAIIEAITAPFKKNNKEVETSLIDQFEYPKKGPGQLYDKMLSEILKMGGKIIYNSEVDNIILDENNNIQRLICKDGNSYEVDECFSSMPIKDLIIAIGDRIVPNDVYRVASTLPYRDFITVGLLINKLKIKNKTKIKTLNNIVPDNWIYIQERTVKMGRIQIFNNWSPYMVKDPDNTVWMGLEYFASENDDMWNASDKDFISMAIDELISMGIIESKDNVLDATRVKVKKAYPAYFGSYEEFPIVKDYLNKINNLYCIGRNGQHRYNNMDHSMLCAIVAVDSYLNNDQDKEKVWNVNTEKSYHESKEGK